MMNNCVVEMGFYVMVMRSHKTHVKETNKSTLIIIYHETDWSFLGILYSLSCMFSTRASTSLYFLVIVLLCGEF